jgi:hypothetical protein
MSRNRTRRVISTQPDGSVTIKLDVPGNIWTLAGKISERWGITPFQAMRIILDQMSSIIDKTNGAVLGDVYQTAYEGLLAADSMPLDGLPSIDVSKIHRSAKTKSGFVGVYANGKGFRAMAKQPGEGRVQKSIGTFPSAERAGWARYLFYKKHGMPYGVLEDLLDEEGGEAAFYRDELRRVFEREPTELEVLSELNQALRETGKPEIPYDGVLPPPVFATEALKGVDMVKMREEALRDTGK